MEKRKKWKKGKGEKRRRTCGKRENKRKNGETRVRRWEKGRNGKR